MTDEPSPIFIVGAPRSGTSLLRDLLRSHPNLAFEGESNFVPLFYRAFGDPASDRAARRLAARILACGWVRRWGLEIEPAELSHHRSYAGLVAAIYEEMARAKGKPRWGDKTPPYLGEMPTLAALFPRARFIHIYRDGRDVALSWTEKRFGPSNLHAAALAWRDGVSLGRRDGGRLPRGSYAEVRYEDLVGDPEGTMRGLCAFIGESFTPEVLTPDPLPRAAYRSIIGRREFTRRPPDGAISNSHAGRWRRELRPADVALCESAAGELLSELGYETDGLTRAISARERISWRIASVGSLPAKLARRPAWPRTLLITLWARVRAWLAVPHPRAPRRHARWRARR